MDLGGDAKLLANATAGNGQGLWKIGMWSTSLTITTSAYGIKAGNYTGNITGTSLQDHQSKFKQKVIPSG